MRTTILFLTLFFCATVCAVAQDSTVVRFFVKGGEQYRITIDGELQPLTNKVIVSKGTHKVEIWSFKYEKHTGKIETGKLDSTNYFAELRVSPEFTAYLSEKDLYKRKLFTYKTAPFLISAASIIALPITFYGMKEKHEQLVQDRFYDQYDQVTQASLENTQAQYSLRTTLFVVSVVGAAAGTAGLIFLKPKAALLKEPIFKQQNPFTLEYMNLSYNPYINSPELGLTLRF
ncbi:MAG: hypothetical protein Salg2KO_19510 [Salibacteraceae bacterium]